MWPQQAQLVFGLESHHQWDQNDFIMGSAFNQFFFYTVQQVSWAPEWMNMPLSRQIMASINDFLTIDKTADC